MEFREVEAVRLRDVLASSNNVKWDCLLGECPTFDKRTRHLYWVDILAASVLRVFLPPRRNDADQPMIEFLSLPTEPFVSIGFVALVEDRPEDLIVGTQDGLYLLLDPVWYPYTPEVNAADARGCFDVTKCEKLSAFPVSPYNPSPEHPMRFNDGKVSPQGDIVAGVLQCKHTPSFVREEKSGALVVFGRDHCSSKPSQYRLHAAVVSAVGGVTISNGMDWADASTTVAEDQRHSAFFYIDTAQFDVKRFMWSHDTGRLDEELNLGGGETIWRVGSSAGLRHPLTSRPDGMCIDAEGCLWVAFWGGNIIARLRPPPQCNPGEWIIDAVVKFPPVVTNVSSCCFGPAIGGDTDDCCCLYVTTAKGSTIDDAIDRNVGDEVRGEIFVVDLCEFGITGKPSNLARI